MALNLDFTHPLRSFDASVQLTVADGATTALVGPSGAGKTTVLRVVAGLLRPRHGAVSLGGRVLLDTDDGVDVPPERRGVGYLFQEYALFPHLDVLANVRFGARRGSRVDELLERFQIAHLTRARIRELSGGERQRVALARALALDPGVLLLDEPLSALDSHTKAAVRIELHELLRDLALPTILVTHDFEDAAALADDIGVIVDGRILQSGTATELVANPSDPFVASFTGATLLEGTASAGADGLTEVVLDSGGPPGAQIRAQVASASPSTRGKCRSRATSRPTPPSTTSAPPLPRSCRSGTAPASESARSWRRSQRHRQTAWDYAKET